MKSSKILFAFFLLILISCTKGDPKIQPNETIKPKVYLAVNENSFASYWINDIKTNLNKAVINDINVLNNDVYTVGFQNVLSNGNLVNVAKLWKNGQEINLNIAPSSAVANSIAFAGTNYYIAGYGNNGGADRAIIWKNGLPIELPSDTDKNTYSTAITTQGTDVYVVGYEKYQVGNDFIKKAKYWKNELEIELPSQAENSIANGIKVAGTNVYIIGQEYPTNNSSSKAVIWKNLVATTLSNTNFYANAKSIFIDGQDVYVAGIESDSQNAHLFAKIWKNGTASNVISDISTSSDANAIFVLNNDIYVVGSLLNYPSNVVAKLWKNGQEIKDVFSDPIGTSFNAIFVK